MKPCRIFGLLIACVAVVVSYQVTLAQDKVKIRIGTHISISAHLFMQKKPDVLKHMGKTYDVEWVRFSGSGDAMPALVAGKLDGCLATPFPLANALFQSRVPVTIVHQLLSFGFDGYYDDSTVVRADSGINTVADLKGKIFGVNAIGSTVEQNMRIMARKSGLDPERDITIVEGPAAVSAGDGARQQGPSSDPVPAVLRTGHGQGRPQGAVPRERYLRRSDRLCVHGVRRQVS